MFAPLLTVLLLAQARPETIARQAEAARDADRVDEAIRLYRRGTAASPKWSEGWWNLGTLLYDRNAYTDAKVAFEKFVKLEPKAAPGWAFLGLCEYELHDYGPSLEHLQKALKAGLPNGDALAKVSRYHAALLLTRIGEFENALQLFAQLAVQGAGDHETIVATGIAGLRIAILPDMLPESEKDLAFETGHAIRESGARREAEAWREFADLISRHPAQSELHDLFGRALVSSDPDRALEEWKKELTATPKHVPARLEIAFEYLKRGQAEMGLQYAREAVEREPGLFAAHNAVGQLLIRTGDLAGGVAELEKARDLAPRSPETRAALASAYGKAGRSADAARERA